MSKLLTFGALVWVVMIGTGAYAGGIYTIPGHWIDDATAFQPIVGDFVFTDITVAPTGSVIITGDLFLLAISMRTLQITFANDAALFLSSGAATAQAMWAGGTRYTSDPGSQPVLARKTTDWRAVDMTSLPMANSSIWQIRLANEHDGYAFAIRYGVQTEVGANPIENLLLRYDGVSWQIEMCDDWAWPHELRRICYGQSGEWWAVGTTGARIRRPLAIVKRHDVWHEVSTEQIVITPDGFNDVACLPGGGIAATNAGLNVVYVYRFGHWEERRFPEEFGDYKADAVAAVGDDDIWVAAENVGHPYVFLHWLNGTWTVVPGPTLPGGRTDGYGVNAMAFASPTDGWAAVHDGGGPGVVRGLVFHYDGTSWRNRNWNWHFWDERWFGLFGHH